MEVVNFNMLVEINQLLRDKGIEYSLHSIGGCSSCGLEIVQNGKEHDFNDIINIVNQFLLKYWIKVIPHEENPYFLNVVSRFHELNKGEK